jgi:hypothetical protein
MVDTIRYGCQGNSGSTYLSAVIGCIVVTGSSLGRDIFILFGTEAVT